MELIDWHRDNGCRNEAYLFRSQWEAVMVTAFKLDVERPIVRTPLAPPLRIMQQTDPYAPLERHETNVGATGLHPAVLVMTAGGYAAMLASFWAMFARDLSAIFVLCAITGLMLVYFTLLFGGILLADAPTPGSQRSFPAFLRGQVDTLTGLVEGREALLMIAGPPAVLAVMAAAIGLIANLSLA
ncbi:MAG: hypothetical protein CMN74_05470 [Sphingorhabdus sp.]|nr:hypothetical protein [Sphingorhabdus sp.]